MARILLLDDENDFVDSCAKILKKEYQIVKTGSPFEAISFLDAGRMIIDLVICDYNMPGMNGLEFLEATRKIGIKVPVVLLTGSLISPDDPRYADFRCILNKPFDGKKLMESVNRALSKDGATESKNGSGRPTHQTADAILESLRHRLTEKGIESPENLDPGKSMRLFGPGEANDCFLAWYYLERAKKYL